MPKSAFPLLQSAILFASKAHEGQNRDGDPPLPYITHPIDVVIRLRYVGKVSDEEVLCAGALHDVVEETDISFAKIEEHFGPNVTNLVRELTREELSKEQRATMSKDEIWAERTRRLIEEIAQMSSRAQTVKLADRLSNLTEAKLTRTGEFLDRYLGQTQLILQTIQRSVNPGLWDAVQALHSKDA